MTERATMRTNLLVYFSVLAVPAVFLLHNLNFFRGLLFYREVYWLMAGYLLLPLFAFFLLKWLVEKCVVLLALTFVIVEGLFFFFGALQDFLVQFPTTQFFSKTYILPFLFLTPLIFIWRKKIGTFQLLQAFGVALFFFLLSEMVIFVLNLSHFIQEPALQKNVTLEKTGGHRLSNKPNVHHLIFDGYANSPTLKKVFNFNNPIDTFLLNRGFYVAGKTKSNYNFTPYSLAATLHLNYLQLEEKQLVRDYKNYLLGAAVYQQNEVFRFFRQQRCNVSHFSVLDDYSHLDKLGTFVPKTPFYSLRYQTLERVVMNPWLWQKATGATPTAIPPSVKRSLHYYARYNQLAFQQALRPSNNRLPDYRFIHFLLPHEPYVFSKPTIEALQLPDLMDYNNGYIRQVAYANQLIKQLVNVLQQDKNNIIILQGDHGFRDYDPQKFSPLTQNEAFNAFYFPDKNYHMLYDSISPVNTYRVVLNQYYGQTLPLLPDEHFVPAE